MSEDDDLFELTINDNETVNCKVLALFDVASRSYIALLPVTDGLDEIIFYGCNENVDNDNLELFTIDSDEEFDIVSQSFCKLMENIDGNL